MLSSLSCGVSTPPCTKATSTPESGLRSSARLSTLPCVLRSSTLMPSRASTLAYWVPNSAYAPRSLPVAITRRRGGVGSSSQYAKTSNAIASTTNRPAVASRSRTDNTVWRIARVTLTAEFLAIAHDTAAGVAASNGVPVA